MSANRGFSEPPRSNRVYNNQSSTGAPPGQWPFSTPLPSPGHSSAPTDYSDYRYDVVPLPPAGISSKQRQYLADQARGVASKRPSIEQCLSARRIGHDPPTVLGSTAESERKGCDEFLLSSRARLNPHRFQGSAGQVSAKAVTSIHQNLYDIEANHEQTRRMEAGEEIQVNPRQAVNERVKRRAEAPTQFSGQLCGGDNTHGSKAEGECGQCRVRTDPITHFASEGRNFGAFDWWKPSTKPTLFGGSHTQTWTWQTMAGPSNDEKHRIMQDPENARAARVDVVSCRGERIYNMCGAEDMLPAGIYAHIKCDVPPAQSHILANDRAQLPICARVHPPPPKDAQTLDMGCSKKIWNVFRNGAHSKEAYAKEAQEDDRRRRRAESARPRLQTVGSARELPEDDLPMFVRCRRPLGYYKAANPITGSEADEFSPMTPKKQMQRNWSQESPAAMQRNQSQERPQVPPQPDRPTSDGSNSSTMGRRANSARKIEASSRGVVAASPIGSVAGSREEFLNGSGGGSRKENVRRSSNASVGDSRRSPTSTVASEFKSPQKASSMARSPGGASETSMRSPQKASSMARSPPGGASDTSMRSPNSRPSSTSKASFADLTKSRWQ